MVEKVNLMGPVSTYLSDSLLNLKVFCVVEIIPWQYYTILYIMKQRYRESNFRESGACFSVTVDFILNLTGL